MRTTMMMLVLALVTVGPVLAQQDQQKVFLEAVAAGDLGSVKAMLARDASLAGTKRPSGASAVMVALFSIAKGEETFHNPATNEVLHALLAAKPHLDLFDTAAVGSAEEMDSMLRADPEALTRRTSFGWTLLHLAAFGGDPAVVELLIRKGADVNARAGSKFRNTPLQTALLCGQVATTKVLLDHGADPLVRQSKGATPMHEAALIGRVELLELLVQHGAELSSVSDNGMTPLAEAIRGGRHEAEAWLRAKGAVVGIQADEDAVKAKKEK